MSGRHHNAQGEEGNGSDRPLIGITMGDPAGIGAELIVRALDDIELRQQGRFLIFGLHEALLYAADNYEITPYWFRRSYDSMLRIESGVVVADFDEFGIFPRPVRQPTRMGGEASMRFLSEAIARAKAGRLDAIVTAPLSLESWKHAGIRHDSLPHMLADAFRVRRFTKILLGGPLRVALASDNEPLFALWHRFAIGLVFHPIDRLHQVLRTCFAIERPRIGVCSLNPPGVRGGRYGDEEDRIIEPAITMAREGGMQVEGPIPAAEAFTRRNGCRFDGVVALYHDQGAVAVRLMAPEGMVIGTLGLPTIHLAPQTGPSFESVGQDRVHIEPMKKALQLACVMARNRNALQAGPIQ